MMQRFLVNALRNGRRKAKPGNVDFSERIPLPGQLLFAASLLQNLKPLRLLVLKLAGRPVYPRKPHDGRRARRPANVFNAPQQSVSERVWGAGCSYVSVPPHMPSLLQRFVAPARAGARILSKYQTRSFKRSSAATPSRLTPINPIRGSKLAVWGNSARVVTSGFGAGLGAG